MVTAPPSPPLPPAGKLGQFVRNLRRFDSTQGPRMFVQVPPLALHPQGSNPWLSASYSILDSASCRHASSPGAITSTRCRWVGGSRCLL
jgi:hypothetical protein